MRIYVARGKPPDEHYLEAAKRGSRKTLQADGTASRGIKRASNRVATLTGWIRRDHLVADGLVLQEKDGLLTFTSMEMKSGRLKFDYLPTQCVNMS